jgi:hypothetical protein
MDVLFEDVLIEASFEISNRFISDWLIRVNLLNDPATGPVIIVKGIG